LAEDGSLIQREGHREILYSQEMDEYFRQNIYQKEEGLYDPYGYSYLGQKEKWLNEVYGKSTVQQFIDYAATKEGRHTLLETLGWVVDGADFVDAVLYILEGDWENAAWSAIGAIPVMGDAIRKGARILWKGADGLKAGGQAIKAVRRGGRQLLEGSQLMVKAGKEELVESVKLVFHSSKEMAGSLDNYLRQTLRQMQDVLQGSRQQLAFAGIGRMDGNTRIAYEILVPEEEGVKATKRLLGGGKLGEGGARKAAGETIEKLEDMARLPAAPTSQPPVKPPTPPPVKPRADRLEESLGEIRGRKIDLEDGIPPKGSGGESKGGTSTLQTGGRQIDYNEFIKRLKTIDAEYENIRINTIDISRIAQNTGMPEWKISRIKEHVFSNDHILDSGIKRFDADSEIADAWYRLTNGNYNQNDIALLNHEYFESKFENLYKTDYRTAHNKTEESGRIWDPYKEDN